MDRISELPKQMDASPLYEKLHLLQSTKKDLGNQLIEINNRVQEKDETINYDDFKSFTHGYHRLLEVAEGNPEAKGSYHSKVSSQS